MKLSDGTYYPEVNFNANLPVFDEDKPGLFNYRRLLLYQDVFDTTYRELYKGDVIGMSSSELKLNQTPREFFGLIDSLLRSNAIDLDVVREMQRDKLIDDVFQLVAPVYNTLMLMGYKEYPDLTI